MHTYYYLKETMIIESKNNNIIKHCIQIKDKKYSQIFSECFVETEKVIKDLMDNSFNLKSILVNEKSILKYESILNKISSKNINYITDSICKYLSDTSSSTDIFAIVEIPHSLKKSGKYLVLDNIQDPSNFGAIIRSAVAFGFTNIISISSVYPYSFKSIRSSMANIFKVNFEFYDYNELYNFKLKNNYKIVIADMNGKSVENFKNQDNLLLVIGSEGLGVSSQIRNMADTTISIPMQNNVESLNASVSAGILMFYLK